MAIPLKKFDATGVLVTDEIVRCDQEESINGDTFFLGFLNFIPNSNLVGAGSTYSVWDAASQTGNQKTVILDGFPGGASVVAVDRQNGVVYSTVADDLYFTYLAHEPIKHNIANVSIAVPWQLVDGESLTLAEKTFPFFVKFAYIMVNIEGGLPSAPATLTITNGTESENFLLDDTLTTELIELSDVMKVTTSETLTISTTDGNGAYGINLDLLDL